MASCRIRPSLCVHNRRHCKRRALSMFNTNEIFILKVSLLYYYVRIIIIVSFTVIILLCRVSHNDVNDTRTHQSSRAHNSRGWKGDTAREHTRRSNVSRFSPHNSRVCHVTTRGGGNPACLCVVISPPAGQPTTSSYYYTVVVVVIYVWFIIYLHKTPR